MTQTAELRAPEARPAEDDERYRRALLAALHGILKRRIITLYCIGFLDVRQTQKLIDTFSLREA
jgi:hypothetical protein